MTKLSIAAALVSLSLAAPAFACPAESHEATAQKSDTAKDAKDTKTAKAADKAKPADKAKDAKAADKAKDAKPADTVSIR